MLVIGPSKSLVAVSTSRNRFVQFQRPMYATVRRTPENTVTKRIPGIAVRLLRIAVADQST
jgi:hypothetical protein